jgi:hypothetical protein
MKIIKQFESVLGDKPIKWGLGEDGYIYICDYVGYCSRGWKQYADHSDRIEGSFSIPISEMIKIVDNFRSLLPFI